MIDWMVRNFISRDDNVVVVLYIYIYIYIYIYNPNKTSYRILYSGLGFQYNIEIGEPTKNNTKGKRL